MTHESILSTRAATCMSRITNEQQTENNLNVYGFETYMQQLILIAQKSRREHLTTREDWTMLDLVIDYTKYI